MIFREIQGLDTHKKKLFFLKGPLRGGEGGGVKPPERSLNPLAKKTFFVKGGQRCTKYEPLRSREGVFRP